jgi:hypothetical protein
MGGFRTAQLAMGEEENVYNFLGTMPSTTTDGSLYYTDDDGLPCDEPIYGVLPSLLNPTSTSVHRLLKNSAYAVSPVNKITSYGFGDDSRTADTTTSNNYLDPSYVDIPAAATARSPTGNGGEPNRKGPGTHNTGPPSSSAACVDMDPTVGGHTPSRGFMPVDRMTKCYGTTSLFYTFGEGVKTILILVL